MTREDTFLTDPPLTGTPESEQLVTTLPARRRIRPKTALSQQTKFGKTMLGSKAHFVHYIDSKFGKDAPRFTIGSSRRPPAPPEAVPGPGAYTPPADPATTRKMKIRFPMAQDRDTTISVDNVEMVNLRTFPEMKLLNIGARPNRPFYDVIESPGPNYLPSSSLSVRAHKIGGNRKPEVIDRSAPPPGTYTPKHPGESTAPRYTFSGPSSRDQWLNIEGKPGPSDYRPKTTLIEKRVPEWTIGERSRRSNRRKHPNPPKSRFFGVDRFVIPLDMTADLDAEWSYIDTHPDLREVIKWVMNRIMDEKPMNPVAFMKKLFVEIKPPETDAPREYDPLDYINDKY